MAHLLKTIDRHNLNGLPRIVHLSWTEKDGRLVITSRSQKLSTETLVLRMCAMND